MNVPYNKNNLGSFAEMRRFKNNLVLVTIITAFCFCAFLCQSLEAKIVNDGPWTGHDYEMKDSTLTYTLYTVTNGIVRAGNTEWE